MVTSNKNKKKNHQQIVFFYSCLCYNVLHVDSIQDIHKFIIGIEAKMGCWYKYPEVSSAYATHTQHLISAADFGEIGSINKIHLYEFC